MPKSINGKIHTIYAFIVPYLTKTHMQIQSKEREKEREREREREREHNDFLIKTPMIGQQ